MALYFRCELTIRKANVKYVLFGLGYDWLNQVHPIYTNPTEQD